MKKSRVARPAAALALTLLLATGCSGGPGSPQSGGAVTIGVAAPLSGPDASLGQPIANAVELAVKKANASGDYGVTFAASAQDDQESPATATTLARRFCSEKDVIGVVGNLASSLSQSSQPVTNGCGLTQITPSASNDQLTERGLNNFFRTTAVNSLQAKRAVEWVRRELPAVRRIATIDANDATTGQLTTAFSEGATKVGLETSDAAHVTTGAGDFSGALTSVLASKPDLLFMALFVNDAAVAVKQARALGYKGEILGIDAAISPDLVNIAGKENVEGVYLTNLGLDPASAPSAREFYEAYKMEFGSDPSTYAANAYDAANVLMAAWKAADTKDRTGVLESMPGISIPGTQGMIAFTKTGDLIDAQIGVLEVKGGNFVAAGTA